MVILKFDHDSDLPDLNAWLAIRGNKPATADSLARIGYMAYYEQEPVACAFLRMAEGRFCFIDGLATNPKVKGETRHAAIDSLVEVIIARAELMGMENILAWSLDKGTLERATRHGFEATPYTLITRKLAESKSSL